MKFIEYKGQPLVLCDKLLSENIFQGDEEGISGIKDL